MRLRFLVLSALVAVGCGSPSEPERPSFSVSRIQIESVTIRTAESVPVQVFAHVKGWIGDSCDEFLPLEQDRSGRVVTLEIKRRRQENVPCLLFVKLFDQQIRLPGEFGPGDYTLQLNGRAYPFRVD